MASEGEAGSAATTEPEAGEGYGSFMQYISYFYKNEGRDSDYLWKYKTTETLFFSCKRC